MVHWYSPSEVIIHSETLTQYWGRRVGAPIYHLLKITPQLHSAMERA
jgi:hypothetical protein